jgi:putative transcriptional regulator
MRLDLEINLEVVMVPRSLKQICKENNITLTKLGQKIGKSKQYMSELARGNIRLTYNMAVEIAEALNTTPDDLFLSDPSNGIGQPSGTE